MEKLIIYLIVGFIAIVYNYFEKLRKAESSFGESGGNREDDIPRSFPAPLEVFEEVQEYDYLPEPLRNVTPQRKAEKTSGEGESLDWAGMGDLRFGQAGDFDDDSWLETTVEKKNDLPAYILPDFSRKETLLAAIVAAEIFAPPRFMRRRRMR